MILHEQPFEVQYLQQQPPQTISVYDQLGNVHQSPHVSFTDAKVGFARDASDPKFNSPKVFGDAVVLGPHPPHMGNKYIIHVSQNLLFLKFTSIASPNISQLQPHVSGYALQTPTNKLTNVSLFNTPIVMNSPIGKQNFQLYEDSPPDQQATAMRTQPFNVIGTAELAETGSRGGLDVAAAAQPSDAKQPPFIIFEDDSNSPYAEVCHFWITCK